jgi:hypothetical protein
VADTLEELVGLAPGEDQVFEADGTDDDEEGDNGEGDTESN